MSLKGRISRVLANSISQRLARNAPRGFGLESVRVREWKCKGESAYRSLWR